MNISIESMLSEQSAIENMLTSVEVTEGMLQINLEAKIASKYARPDCQAPVEAHPHDRESVRVQGLALTNNVSAQGKALRYQVTTVRLGYLNDAGEFKTFMVPIPGIRMDLLITDEVMDRFLYFNVDRNLSLAESVQMLDELYGVKSSTSALERWKTGEAEALPSMGEMIKMLNEKKKITTLHLDEYKATGTKSWELAIRDEHDRLLFSIRLKKRDAWHIKAILRWFRILGLEIKLFYVDFWLAYPPAIHAIYPQAEIQYDFFHVIQNIHRHLYKALTAYRKAFKNAATDKQQAKIRQQLHKELWQHRYLLFTNDENLNEAQRQILEQLIQEHAGTIVEQIVLFRQQIRVIFNECDSFMDALEHLAVLTLDGWTDLSSYFAKIMNFLQEHSRNMLTYLRIPKIQRNSLSECTVRSLRRIEHFRQGFKKHAGRVNHLKLLQWRTYFAT